MTNLTSKYQFNREYLFGTDKLDLFGASQLLINWKEMILFFCFKLETLATARKFSHFASKFEIDTGEENYLLKLLRDETDQFEFV